MSSFSVILYSGIYEILTEYLDFEDVYELTLLNDEWELFLGRSFQKYWQKASISTFGIRLEFLRHNNDKDWFKYFEYLNTSNLQKFLVKRKKSNELLLNVFNKLKVEKNDVNIIFSLENISSIMNLSELNIFNDSSHYDSLIDSIYYIIKEYNLNIIESNIDYYNYSEYSITLRNINKHNLSRIELDFGGLGKGYIWEMNIVSITSQNITLRTECKIKDIPYWNVGKVLIEYIAVWGLINEDDYFLLYHHKNPFHKKSEIVDSNDNSSNLSGINYFLSAISSFAGLEMNIDDIQDKFIICITLQTNQIIQNLLDHISKHFIIKKNYNDLLKFNGNILNRDSLCILPEDEPINNNNEFEMSKYQEQIMIIRPRMNANIPSYLNIELQLKDQISNIPLYLYGDIQTNNNILNNNFTELKVLFNKNDSSLIKTNCLYDIGLSIIDQLTGDIVLNIVFQKSKSYYERKFYNKSKKLLKLCSYTRIYGTHVPVVDPPCYLTSKPESILTKLEILINPYRSTIGRITELNISLNMQECRALLPIKKFKRIMGVQNQLVNIDCFKKRFISPIKNIYK